MTRRTKTVAGSLLALSGAMVGHPVFAAVTAPKVAAVPSIPSLTLQTHGTSSPDQTLTLLVILTVLTFIPAILLTMTAFTRIITVLSFTRSAMGLTSTPPNQVLIGLALFLTIYVMSPTLGAIDHQALVPYLQGHMTLAHAGTAAMRPLRTFMLSQTRSSDIALFLHLKHLPVPHRSSQVSTTVLIPAFIISELKTAFEIGVYIYIPFMIIDLVVATVLMSMGMFMMPPTLVSLPLKLLLFVLANGWDLIIQSLVLSFHH